jgi:nitrate/TMAO reductase-like tetraheme cytochrome c subunit
VNILGYHSANKIYKKGRLTHEKFLLTTLDFIKRRPLVVAVALVVLIGIGSFAMKQASANPAFCGSCHNIQPYVDGYLGSDLLAHDHNKANIKCIDCHNKTISRKNK